MQVTKSQPVTGCRKEPIELCSRDGCGFSEVQIYDDDQHSRFAQRALVKSLRFDVYED